MTSAAALRQANRRAADGQASVPALDEQAHPTVPHGQPCLWGLMFVLVVLAHGSLIMLMEREVPTLEPVAEPAMMIDMAPVAASEPAIPQPDESKVEDPPPPDIVPPLDAVRPPDVVPPPDPVPAPTQETVEPPSPPVAEPVPPEPEQPVPPLPEVAHPPVVIPKRASVVLRPRPPAPVHQDVPPLTPAVTAPAPPVTAPASASTASSVPVPWQTRLLAHLNRFKRFPPEAQMQRRQGTAMVHLRLLPDGSAQAVRLQRSSGSDVLDQEATALIARAQPLPGPDAGTGAIEIDVPIQFTIR